MVKIGEVIRTDRQGLVPRDVELTKKTAMCKSMRSLAHGERPRVLRYRIQYLSVHCLTLVDCEEPAPKTILAIRCSNQMKAMDIVPLSEEFQLLLPVAMYTGKLRAGPLT